MEISQYSNSAHSSFNVPKLIGFLSKIALLTTSQTFLPQAYARDCRSCRETDDLTSSQCVSRQSDLFFCNKGWNDCKRYFRTNGDTISYEDCSSFFDEECIEYYNDRDNYVFESEKCGPGLEPWKIVVIVLGCLFGPGAVLCMCISCRNPDLLASICSGAHNPSEWGPRPNFSVNP